MSKVKLLATMLICTLVANTSMSDIQNAVKYVSHGNDVVTTKIDSQLFEKLGDMSDDEEVKVSIQLVDTLDTDVVECEAYKQAGIDKDEFEKKQAEALEYDDEENETYQEQLIAEYDKMKAIYNNSLVDYYTELCIEFLSNNNINVENKDEYVSPFIDDVLISKGDIYQLTKNEMVEKIYFYDEYAIGRDFDSINNTYSAIGGNTAINNGYKGSGIKVGVIESGNPNKSLMGSDYNNITIVRATSALQHTSLVAGIIKKFAPSCAIYSYGVANLNEVITGAEKLITTYGVHVINISYGEDSSGVYDSYSNRLDYLAYKYRVPIVVASGNAKTTRDSVNNLCMGPNVIAVGAVTSSGNSLASARFSYWKYTNTSTYTYANSGYKEGIAVSSSNAGKVVVNKPDICAPGVVTMYGKTDQGTSFATPHVTGTIVQMMSRNSGMIGKPEALKAALIASAHFTSSCSETNSYVPNTNSKVSDVFGAGVIDSDFCYWVARNGRQSTNTVTQSTAATNTTYLSKQVYVDTVASPFRVAVSWSASHYYNTGMPYCNDYDVRIYKNGTLVKSSTAWTNSTTYKNINFEVIELSKSELAKYGAGYYEVRVVRTGSWQGSGTVKYYIGMAWEQY